MKAPRSIASYLIDEFVYNEQHRKLVKRRLLDDVKYEDLSEEFDISVRHAKQIVKDETEKLNHLI